MQGNCIYSTKLLPPAQCWAPNSGKFPLVDEDTSSDSVSKVAQFLLNQIVNKNKINVTVAAYVKMKEAEIIKKGDRQVY